jgi:hypothetical protein
MNKGIAHILKNKLTDLQFIDLFGGLVYTQEYEDLIEEKKVVTRLPVTCDVTNNSASCLAHSGELVPMIPEQLYKGLLYFEGSQVKPLGLEKGAYRFETVLRLICWLNTKHIAAANCYNLSTPLMTEIIYRLAGGNPYNSFPYTRVFVEVQSIPTADKNLFSAYTYDHLHTQFLMTPFETFGIDFKVSFSVHPSCMNQLQMKTPDQC